MILKSDETPYISICNASSMQNCEFVKCQEYGEYLYLRSLPGWIHDIKLLLFHFFNVSVLFNAMLRFDNYQHSKTQIFREI